MTPKKIFFTSMARSSTLVLTNSESFLQKSHHQLSHFLSVSETSSAAVALAPAARTSWAPTPSTCATTAEAAAARARASVPPSPPCATRAPASGGPQAAAGAGPISSMGTPCKSSLKVTGWAKYVISHHYDMH